VNVIAKLKKDMPNNATTRITTKGGSHAQKEYPHA